MMASQISLRPSLGQATLRQSRTTPQRLRASRPMAMAKAATGPRVKLMMTKNPVTLMDTDKIEVAATMFLKRGFSHAPVLNASGDLVGVISETDLLFWKDEAVSQYEEDMDDRKVNAEIVSDAMTANIITVESTTMFDQAAHIMLTKKIHCLPVVDDNKKLIGLVTRKDIMRYTWRSLPMFSN